MKIDAPRRSLQKPKPVRHPMPERVRAARGIPTILDDHAVNRAFVDVFADAIAAAERREWADSTLDSLERLHAAGKPPEHLVERAMREFRYQIALDQGYDPDAVGRIRRPGTDASSNADVSLRSWKSLLVNGGRINGDFIALVARAVAEPVRAQWFRDAMESLDRLRLRPGGATPLALAERLLGELRFQVLLDFGIDPDAPAGTPRR